MKDAINRRTFLSTRHDGGESAGGWRDHAGVGGSSDQRRRGSGGQHLGGQDSRRLQGKVSAFKGIPYGASTEGAGRFMPPSKVQGWTGVRDALEVGPASPQNPSILVAESMAQQPKADGAGTEDCLHVNVWTQSTSGGKRPVMVWFHGGGYSAGSGNWEMYNGANLAAKHDVVVVTVNHRLKRIRLPVSGGFGRREVCAGEQRGDARLHPGARMGAR